MIGASSLLNIGVGVLRTKAFALLLGPAEFGLLGLYSSIVDLVQLVATFGLSASGVRAIAESAGSGDIERIARTATVLKRATVALGLLGAVFLVVFSPVAAQITFGAADHAPAIALLSLAVFFRVLASGQGALLQGMQRIRDLAWSGVMGALLGTIIAVPVVYFFPQAGLAPSLVFVAAMSAAVTWWYSRKLEVPETGITFLQFRHEASAMLTLGLAFLASGFLTMGAAYIVRVIVYRQIGPDAAGLYSSAWTLGGLYVGYILQAMGADFYPQLVKVSKDHSQCNRLVNEQTHVNMLLAGPGVIGTLTFAPVVVTLFYSAKFAHADDVLRWICLGMAMRVITWPMGYIIVAKNLRSLFFGCDLAWTIVNLGLTWLCVAYFGLEGAGIAFFGSYIFHAVLVYPIVNNITGFHWSPENRKAGVIFFVSIAIAFGATQILSPLWAALFGAAIALLSAFHSLHTLLHLVSPDRIPRRIQKLLDGRLSRLVRPLRTGS